MLPLNVPVSPVPSLQFPLTVSLLTVPSPLPPLVSVNRTPSPVRLPLIWMMSGSPNEGTVGQESDGPTQSPLPSCTATWDIDPSVEGSATDQVPRSSGSTHPEMAAIRRNECLAAVEHREPAALCGSAIGALKNPVRADNSIEGVATTRQRDPASGVVVVAVVGAVGLLQYQMGVSIASRASVRHIVAVVAPCFPVEPDSRCMLSR